MATAQVPSATRYAINASPSIVMPAIVVFSPLASRNRNANQVGKIAETTLVSNADFPQSYIQYPRTSNGSDARSNSASDMTIPKSRRGREVMSIATPLVFLRLH